MSTDLRQSSGLAKKSPLQLITNPIIITSKNYLTIPQNDDAHNHFIPSSASRADSRTEIEESLGYNLSMINDTTTIPNTKAMNTEREDEIDNNKITLVSQNNTEYENLVEDGPSPIKLIARKNSKPLPFTEIKKLGKQIFNFCGPTEDTEADDDHRKNSGHYFSLGIVKTESTLPEIKKEDDPSLSQKHGKNKSDARKRWHKLSHIIHSIHLLKSTQVKSISHSNIQGEISQFKIKNQLNKKKDLAREESAQEAFDFVRRVNLFCECASIGSIKHVQNMKEIIDKDPKKHILNHDDPSHILNKKNQFGFTPLYLASKNGNILVVEFLIKSKADPYQTSIVGTNNEKHLPIHVAVQWNHQKVVEFLIENVEFSYAVLRGCIKLAPNKTIKKIIQKHMEKRFPNLVSNCSCL